MEKIQKFFRNDYGIKNYSFNFLKKKKGYNKRKTLNYIKNSSILQLEEELLKVLEKHQNLQKSENIAHLKELLSFRGMRHIKNLPVRGQRTKTNSRTIRRKAKLKLI